MPRCARRISDVRLSAWLLSLVLPVAAAAAAAAPAPAAPGLDLAAYKGRVVVVDFWASWCAPCRRSIPWLNQMRARYGDHGLVVIGVNVDKDAGDAARFLRDVPIEFEVVYDPEGVLAERFALEGMPSSYVYSRDGELVARHLGFQNSRRPEYEALLGRLLK
jgi:thiol-disulfide isomerase/thioredoxin